METQKPCDLKKFSEQIIRLEQFQKTIQGKVLVRWQKYEKLEDQIRAILDEIRDDYQILAGILSSLESIDKKSVEQVKQCLDALRGLQKNPAIAPAVFAVDQCQGTDCRASAEGQEANRKSRP